MDDKELRSITRWSLIATAAVTVAATLMAIGFTFSVTAETVTTLTTAQKDFLRRYFFQYVGTGGFMIFAGLYFGWLKIFGKSSRRKDSGQKTL